MDDRVGMAPVAAFADETGTDSSGSGSQQGSDSAEGAFAVGDRVIWEIREGERHPAVIIQQASPSRPWHWMIRLDEYPSADIVAAYESELTHEEPVPFELTVEAENALDEPWPELTRSPVFWADQESGGPVYLSVNTDPMGVALELSLDEAEQLLDILAGAIETAKR